MNTYTYTAYGLGLHSVLQLPELIPGSIRKDVVVSFGAVAYNREGLSTKVYDNWVEGGDVYLYWDEVGTFLIRGGREVIIDLVPGADEGRVRLFLLGAAMGVILHQRGLLVLHASAVAMSECGVALIGGKSKGKSTLAASLLSRGWGYLADDLVALQPVADGMPKILPAFPQLKLWPDAVVSLGEDPDSWPQLTNRFEKRDCRIRQGFSERAVTLERIYVLGVGEEVGVTQLAPKDAVLHLIANTYATRYGTEILHMGGAAHLSQCSLIANTVPVFMLVRPSSFELLKLTAEIIEAGVEEGLAIEALAV